MNGESVFTAIRLSFQTSSPRDMLGEAHPRLRQRQPKGFVSVVFRSPRHCYTFFRAPAMILRGPHHTIPD